MEPQPALVVRARPLLGLGVDLDERGVDVEDTGAVPVVAAERRHTSGAPRRTPRPRASLTSGVISWKVRNTVESDGAEPKRSAWARRCSMSAQLSPPPASISSDWTSTLPRSCSGSAHPKRDREKRAHLRAPTVGKGPKSVESDVAHHLVTAGCHNQATRAVTVHFVSALLVWGLGVSTTSVSPDRRQYADAAFSSCGS